MDYDTIIDHLNPFGKYQLFVCLILNIGSSLNSMTSLVLNFIMTQHIHRCQIPHYDLDHYSQPGSVFINTTNGELNYNVTECTIEFNGTTTKCNSWVYDQGLFKSTIISKFDVVCDEKFFRAHFLMAHYIGLLVGSILCGFLSDIIGRKPVLVLGIMSMLIAVVTRPFVPSLEMVTFLEFINGFGSMVSYLVPFVLLTELVGPKMRLFASFCVYLGFCVGLYLLLILVYFIREWELLMWAIGVPIGIFALVVIFFLDESPRWLISRGKMEDAMQSLKTIAKVNKMTLSLSVKDITIKDERTATFTQFLKELIKSKSLLWRLTIVSLNWFALNLVYYGISMNVAKFGGDLFVNYAASSAAELLAILFCWYTANKIGRKKLFCTVMILGGVTCTSTIFTYLYANESQTWLTTSLAMIGKFFVSIAFFVVYMFTAELFPTVLRASSLGFASMTGRLGAISSAYIAELGTLIPSKFGSALPLFVYGVVGLTGGILSLYLPETTDIILPEYVNDAININRPEQNSQKSDGGEKSSVNNESQNGITYF